MPIATPEVYAAMLDAAKANSYAFPAINITSSQTLNAALAGFAEAGSDGIIQVSTGGAEYASGPTIKNMVAGAVALAEYAHVVAKNYPVNIAVHTDHCPEGQAAGLRTAAHRHLHRAREERPEPAVPVAHVGRLGCAAVREPVDRAGAARADEQGPQILEIEVGVVGGEEDGVANEINEKLYSTVEDGLATIEALGLGENGRYITALTFGNVHGVYKPGAVKLRPAVLKEIQDAVGAKYGLDKPFSLVFHGGSGSSAQEISDAVDYGVVKMNIDTDTQYAFTRPVAGWMFANYAGVLKIDGDVGNKKLYDPRAWGKEGEKGVANRVIEAATELRSAGKTLGV